MFANGDPTRFDAADLYFFTTSLVVANLMTALLEITVGVRAFDNSATGFTASNGAHSTFSAILGDIFPEGDSAPFVAGDVFATFNIVVVRFHTTDLFLLANSDTIIFSIVDTMGVWFHDYDIFAASDVFAT